MDFYSFRSAGEENISNGTSSDMLRSGPDGWLPPNSAEQIGHGNFWQPSRTLPADLGKQEQKPVSKQRKVEKAVIRIVKKRNSEEVSGKISVYIWLSMHTQLSSMLP